MGAVASAFRPMLNSPRTTVARNALFEPVKDQNDYGARNRKKQLRTGEITKKSYVPDGLTAAQYKKIRADQDSKKKANYEKNVKKAGKFEDFTEFYKLRGTEIGGDWLKSAARGHKMVKTKYDWGEKLDSKGFF